MFDLNKIFVVTLISLVALVICEDQALKGSSAVPKNASPIKLKDRYYNTASYSSTHLFSGGEPSPQDRLACTFSNSKSWPLKHDVEVKMRCPEFGSASTITYVNVTLSVLYPNAKCFVHEGDIGLDFIGITLKARNTFNFDFRLDIYSRS